MRALLLNPGMMGSAVGTALVVAGQDTMWVTAGRGADSRARAERAGLRAMASLGEALAVADAVFSVVPPASALTTAQAVAELGFRGLYVDANAVSPASAAAVSAAVSAAGASYVDGGIIGPPPKASGDTRLYLAGPAASQAAAAFAGSAFDTVVLDEEAGSTAASALKMAYAGWTKASSALLLNVRAMARAQGVEQALLDEWAISLPDLPERSRKAAVANAFKAWRFVGEMHEIADTMEGAGLPDQFHRGAAALWERLASFKDDRDAAPEDVFETIVRPKSA